MYQEIELFKNKMITFFLFFIFNTISNLKPKPGKKSNWQEHDLTLHLSAYQT